MTINRTIRRTAFQLLRLTALQINLMTGCTDESKTTWDDVRQFEIKTELDGVAFNVPLSYLYGEYAKNLYNWPRISKEIREGKVRKNVDQIKIYALLPNLEPVTEENLPKFLELGWGSTVTAFITHPRSFGYYFKYSAPKILEPLPETTGIPGMLHYLDKNNKDDIYLSHNHATSELTRIRCEYARPDQSPACHVETLYEHRTIPTEKSDVKSTPYYLKYSFSRTFIPQWREIDNKIKLLFTQFSLSASQYY